MTDLNNERWTLRTRKICGSNGGNVHSEILEALGEAGVVQCSSNMSSQINRGVATTRALHDLQKYRTHTDRQQLKTPASYACLDLRVDINHRVFVSEFPHAPSEIKTSSRIADTCSNASSMFPVSARRPAWRMDQPFSSQKPSFALFAKVQLLAYTGQRMLVHSGSSLRSATAVSGMSCMP